MEKDNRIVVKENSFIDSYWNLSLAAHKIFAAIVASVNPTAEEQPRTIQINKEQIKNLRTGLTRVTVNNRLSEIIQELMTFQVVSSSEIVSKGIIREEGFNVFEAYDIDHKLDENGEKVFLSVNLKFTETALPMIHGFTKNFTQYHLESIKKLESPYSARLYEILRRYHPIKKNDVTIVSIELERLKKMLKAEKPGYKRYNNFKQEIIVRAQKDIEKNTDLAFNFEGQRVGRKIEKITFVVRPNDTFEVVEEENTAIEAVLLPEGYDEVIANMLTGMVPELPIATVNLLASRLDAVAVSQALFGYTKAKQEGKIKNPAAYFLGILKHQDKPDSEPEDKPHWTDTSWADGVNFDEF